MRKPSCRGVSCTDSASLIGQSQNSQVAPPQCLGRGSHSGRDSATCYFCPLSVCIEGCSAATQCFSSSFFLGEPFLVTPLRIFQSKRRHSKTHSCKAYLWCLMLQKIERPHSVPKFRFFLTTIENRMLIFESSLNATYFFIMSDTWYW